VGEGREGRAVPEPGDELEVMAEATGVSNDRGGQYVVAKWGKRRASKFLKVEVVMNGEDLEVMSAEVVERSPVSCQDRGVTEGPGEVKF
jgi:hypothetical protein